ncbi:MAG: hypothetical protein WA476_06635 [Acidobacteriaceae bacterium]
MAEAWRKDEPATTAEPLTTADLAGMRTRFAESPTPEPPPPHERDAADFDPADFDPAVDGGPILVRNERQGETAKPAIAGSTGFPKSVSPNISNSPDDPSRQLPKTATTTPLLTDVELTDLRSRWSDIQAGFVDEPRRSVEQADQLVATAIQRLAEAFAQERASLETQWESGADVSTEDLRLALQRYRSFFGRLLNAA